MGFITWKILTNRFFPLALFIDEKNETEWLKCSSEVIYCQAMFLGLPFHSEREIDINIFAELLKYPYPLRGFFIKQGFKEYHHWIVILNMAMKLNYKNRIFITQDATGSDVKSFGSATFLFIQPLTFFFLIFNTELKWRVLN